jgi:hypothetical protein
MQEEPESASRPLIFVATNQHNSQHCMNHEELAEDTNKVMQAKGLSKASSVMSPPRRNNKRAQSARNARATKNHKRTKGVIMLHYWQESHRNQLRKVSDNRNQVPR